MASIQPMGERVLLRQKTSEERTAGGIYIPETAKEQKKEGLIVAVGTRKDGSPLPLKAGDRVLYGGYSADEVEVEGEKLIILNFEDVLARLG